jgi:DmsE family decaheme c-type cytochrome
VIRTAAGAGAAALLGAAVLLASPPPPAPVEPPAAKAGPCLGCHEDARRLHWTGSRHERHGVTCASCHVPHADGDGPAGLKAKTEAETCLGCHAGIRSRTQRTSRHPVRDGRMTCSSCHDPHGSAWESMLPRATAAEACQQCHAAMRGPFVWEHAPAREDCTLCHDAHGSSHRPLLVSRVPYLCQRCHLNVQHPSRLFDLANTGGGGTARRAPEHECVRCHRAVHGSNHPSGAYLER